MAHGDHYRRRGNAARLRAAPAPALPVPEEEAFMNEPIWMFEARKHLGLAEIPGPRHSPVIVGWLARLKAWWAEDELAHRHGSGQEIKNQRSKIKQLVCSNL